MNIAALLLLFAPGSQTLTDEVFQIPAREWRYAAMALKQVPVTVDCEFSVMSSTGAVRVVLVNGDGLEELKQGDRDTLGAGHFARQGAFSRVVSVPDEYAVVVENGGRGPVSVRLRSSLDFSGRGQPQARYLSPARRLAVIAISTTVFLAIVSYSARKLLAALRN
jgi:hypothetical protein